MSSVGGDPDQMTGGAQQIHTCGTALGHLATSTAAGTRAAAGSVGDPGLAAALHRLAALSHAALDGSGTQARTAAQLAAAAAEDLTTATAGS